MVVTPDGKLIIAGDFTSVNGDPATTGLAALDPPPAGGRRRLAANVARGTDDRPWSAA